MRIEKNVDLSKFTSFGTGGPAEVFAVAQSADDVVSIITEQPKPLWLLGTGANSLISDKGLPGTTLQMRLNDVTFDDSNVVIAESGVLWDDLVQQSIDRDLWGLELTSGIPSSVGAAVVGNIAAYGQAVSDTLKWIDVIDYGHTSPAPRRMNLDELEFEYRSSIFSRSNYNKIIILRCAFQLSRQKTQELEYEWAINVANAHNLDPNDLTQRRKIIMTTREEAGSLLDKTHVQKTAGSFFKNPTVRSEQVAHIATFEERPITRQRVLEQNKIHGGAEQRISAGLVLLAAGFRRGQSWGNVRLHPKHILKIENTGAATSQEIYDVAQEIIQVVKVKLDVDLTPEVRFFGEFN